MEDRDIVYIYARTHNTISFGVDDAMEIGRKDSFDFLRPLSDLYQISKSTSISKEKAKLRVRSKGVNPK